jgi:hypothetical protein
MGILVGEKGQICREFAPRKVHDLGKALFAPNYRKRAEN